MFQRLSGDGDRILWINTDHILSMEVVGGIEKGYPATRLIFINGGSEMVHENPEDITSGISA
jgi:hypothetical protein